MLEKVVKERISKLFLLGRRAGDIRGEEMFVKRLCHGCIKKRAVWKRFMGRFSLKDVKKYIKERKKTADKYEMANLQMSGQYLLDAISSSVFADVLAKVSAMILVLRFLRRSLIPVTQSHLPPWMTSRLS